MAHIINSIVIKIGFKNMPEAFPDRSEHNSTYVVDQFTH